VRRVTVETAVQMADAVRSALPADVAVLAAAVADWRPESAAGSKIKKGMGGAPQLRLVENPDILALLSAPGPHRPRLVVGFAAETDDVEANARAKLARKGCDWIVANDVSQPGVMGGDENQVLLVTPESVERWGRAPKAAVAARLAGRIADALA
jgi:phosphopantothenoylcysteine decarboxylase/phosphopantothenate--cysteine ligase